MVSLKGKQLSRSSPGSQLQAPHSQRLSRGAGHAHGTALAREVFGHGRSGHSVPRDRASLFEILLPPEVSSESSTKSPSF